MSQKQWRRYDVAKRLEQGQLTTKKAAELVGLSERQMRRVRRAVAAKGVSALVHGNRGQRAHNRIDEPVRDQVVMLYRETYAGFNDQHFTEKLVEVEGLDLSRSTIRRILRGAGVEAARPRRPPRHRRRRERKPQAGLMMQWDGSRHDWLEGRGPMLSLMGAVDDATTELLPGAHFVLQECAAGYLRVLRAIVADKGVPYSAYQDQHGTLRRNDDFWTLEEELRGRQDPTHVGRALEALGIEPIFALSPQAKGRVERVWGVLQDRLTSELRLARACTVEEANAVLERFRRDYNERFAVAPTDARPAWRRARKGLDLDRICSFHYEAVVLNDNTVRLGGHIFDIPPGPGGRGYARARAEVRQLLDGSWRIYIRNRLVATAPSSELGELRAKKRKKRSAASRAFRKGINQITVSLP